LIDIAILEGRHNDALCWYRKGQPIDAYGGGHKDAELAQAVAKSHPDEAITIWKNLVAGEISHAKPAAYQAAGGYLMKIKGAYERTKRDAEWKAYLAGLLQQNSRRPRMLDVLNSLTGRRVPIISR